MAAGSVISPPVSNPGRLYAFSAGQIHCGGFRGGGISGMICRRKRGIMAEKRLVVLKTFDTRSEAELYRNKLLARRIPADLAGPDTSSTFGAYFGPMSRVSVVATEEAARRLANLGESTISASSARRRTGCHSLQPYTPMRLARKEK
jgi:hypothetical protein